VAGVVRRARGFAAGVVAGARGFLGFAAGLGEADWVSVAGTGASAGFSVVLMGILLSYKQNKQFIPIEFPCKPVPPPHTLQEQAAVAVVTR